MALKFSMTVLSIMIAFSFLGACSAQPETEIAGSTESATANAQAVTLEPSNTPLPPTSTVTPQVQAFTSEAPPSSTVEPEACDLAEFVTDVTVPDGTIFSAGESFTKTWRLKNVGSCTWTPNYQIAFETGDLQFGPKAQELKGEVQPGQTVDISVALFAPAEIGSYRGYWQLQNPSGTRVRIRNGAADSLFFVDIAVVSDVPTFSITIDDLIVTCEKTDVFTVSTTIHSTGPGSVVYFWSTDGYQPYPMQTLVFEQASMTTIFWEIPFSVADPNHPEWNTIQLNTTLPESTLSEVMRQCP